MSAPYDLFGTPGYEQLLAVLGAAEESHTRYERTGRLPDLERALVLFDAVLDRTENIDLRSAAMNGVGTVLWSRYERFGEPADLDGAITLFREALAPYGAEVTVTTPSYWTNLSGALRLRWLRTHDARDLTASVDAIRTALDSTPSRGARRSNRLDSLGDALLSLYHLHGDSAALAEAVESFRAAVACAEPGTEEHAWARSNLAEALRLRHHHSPDGAPEALDEAALLARAVLAAVPRRHRLYPRFLSNLASILAERHQARADPADLREAARAARRAVAATPAGHPNLVQRNAVLATVRRLELIGVADLDTTAPRVLDGGGRRSTRRERRAVRAWVRATAEAYATTPEGHALRGLALLNHGSALGTLAVAEGDPHALAAAIDLCRKAASDPTMDVSVRVGCAHLWALSVIGGGESRSPDDHAAAMEPFRLAVELLPRTASYRIGRMDRARQLGRFAGLVEDAAACALELPDPELALRLLEQGRGVLLAQALDARTDTTDALSRLPDELAAEHARLLPQLDRPEAAAFTSSGPGGTGAAHPAPGTPLAGEDRHALAERWDRLVAAIRREPGCEDFLRLPRTAEMLAGLGDEGPVVMVNISPLRCDALVLREGRVRCVPLTGLSHAEVVRRADAFLVAVRTAGDAALPMSRQRDAQSEIRETLAWLWTAVAEPVLDALALRADGRPGGEFPGRMWWIPTGPLTALPLHAAGRHENDRDNLLDRAVCSYAPTVNSLVHALRRQTARGDRPLPAPTAPLVVAVPEPPGAGLVPLEGARTEAALLAARPGARLLLDEQAVRRTVLDALPHHPWVHFACHAVAADDGAATGQVLLHDHDTAPLTLTDIARLRLPAAELAYLSACETTRGRGEYADEALHITGAFHMAGFTHVIGTLWAVDDDTSQELADHFYSAFAPRHPFPGHTAYALHTAVRAIRDADEGYRLNPSLWAPYIHVGP
ncbi:CHAT domain-containing protein [Streptomyces sp. NPDC090798]|uniref:CHAT domain-containing protein n=1 Tax=Streptomyces sp. NPDC090798 TaxID=3365968 RepID=UPI0038174B88